MLLLIAIVNNIIINMVKIIPIIDIKINSYQAGGIAVNRDRLGLLGTLVARANLAG